jgi:hypothetical protein
LRQHSNQSVWAAEEVLSADPVELEHVPTLIGAHGDVFNNATAVMVYFLGSGQKVFQPTPGIITAVIIQTVFGMRQELTGWTTVRLPGSKAELTRRTAVEIMA